MTNMVKIDATANNTHPSEQSGASQAPKCVDKVQGHSTHQKGKVLSHEENEVHGGHCIESTF